MKKLMLSAFLGGLVVFAWGAISHMVLPIGEMGIKSLPHEETVLSTLSTSIPVAGLYFFPGMESHNMSKEAREAWAAKYRTGPTGLLLYKPIGGEMMQARLFIVEFLSNALAAFLAAWLISRVQATYWRRVVMVGGLGLFAWMSLSVSYWNWYGFPGSYILGEGIDQVVGWLLGGLVISKFASVKRA
jgi:hypothetical protein